MKKELPPGMLLVDVVLRANLFPLQHKVQRYGSISIPQNFPSQGKSLHRLYHLYLLRPLQLPRSPYQRQHSSDAPPAVPPTSEPPITIPGAEYRALLVSFQTLTTTQTTIMERMDHFQLRQDQQTLILREIQQHLGLLPPAPPIAVPSTVAAEDPSYPPEEPTT
ncbi:hypothetical protein CK203_053970 [Vitis vinifera]|uniref:Uncharacterized protein n=1 Tax=Vitis vinifera TaxID=29760 RepID=A0A438D4J5_VITVI|nr:hypothetical protein CK203_094546 [Vitis vinifera]RVW80719.1 hypothetical protein CK203_053970 [Vitis vinifera]